MNPSRRLVSEEDENRLGTEDINIPRLNSQTTDRSPSIERDSVSIEVGNGFGAPRTPLFTLPEVVERPNEERLDSRQQRKSRKGLFPARSSQNTLTKTNSAPGDLPNFLHGSNPFLNLTRKKK